MLTRNDGSNNDELLHMIMCKMDTYNGAGRIFTKHVTLGFLHRGMRTIFTQLLVLQAPDIGYNLCLKCTLTIVNSERIRRKFK